MAKNEHRFIKEWVDYYLNLGFDDIFIYEDYGSRSHKQIFAGYDNVHIYKIADTGIPDYRTCKTQMELMAWFLEKLKIEGKYDWCMFCDVDEFIVFDEGYNLESLCEEFKNETGVLLAWKIFNANGHIKRPEGSVIENYKTTSDAYVDGSYAQSQWNKKTLLNVKNAYKWYSNHVICGAVDVNHNPDIDAPRIYEKAWINHYFTKSWEDFVDRMTARGNMGNSNRSYDNFFEMNPDLLPRKKEMIESVRNIPMNNVQFISKDLKLISGGNTEKIKLINKERNISIRNV